MTRISQRLHDQLARYNWVGFYLVDKADPGMLVVGPYVGSFSPNVHSDQIKDCAEPRPPCGRPSW